MLKARLLQILLAATIKEVKKREGKETTFHEQNRNTAMINKKNISSTTLELYTT